MNNFFSYVYDRRFIDQDVFRRLQAQGEIIKMAIKIEDLNKDGGFWKEEEQITKKALDHLKELKRLKVYDFHKITPQTYDLKIIGDP